MTIEVDFSHLATLALIRTLIKLEAIKTDDGWDADYIAAILDHVKLGGRLRDGYTSFTLVE